MIDLNNWLYHYKIRVKIGKLKKIDILILLVNFNNIVNKLIILYIIIMIKY